MKAKENTDAAVYMARWRNTYKTAFTLCLAITGSESAASEALMNAMRRGGSRGAAKAMELCREEALKNISSRGFYDALASAETGTVLDADEPARRAAFLKYGCRLSVSEISEVLRLKPGAVRAALGEMLDRTESAEPAAELEKLCREELRVGGRAPDEATLTRALQKRLAEAEEGEELHLTHKKIISAVISILSLLLLGFMLWVGSVLFIFIKEKVAEANPSVSITEVTDAAVQGEG